MKIHGRRLNRKGKIWLSGLILIICLIILSILGIRRLLTPTIRVSPESPEFSKYMNKEVKKLTQKSSALKKENFDLTIYDVAKSKTFHWEQGQTDQMYTASTVKIPILVELLHQNSSLSASRKKLVEGMVRQSNNDDATKLFHEIGGVTALNQMFKRYGMKNSHASNHWWLSTVSSKDYMILLKNIFLQSKHMSASDRNYIISEMIQVNKNQRWGIKGFGDANDNNFVANKNGWTLSGTWIMNSIGAVEVKGRLYLVSIMSNQHPDGQGNTGLSVAKKEMTQIVDLADNYVLK